MTDGGQACDLDEGVQRERRIQSHERNIVGEGCRIPKGVQFAVAEGHTLLVGVGSVHYVSAARDGDSGSGPE